MGASKRIAEMYCQSLTSLKGIQTSFITTRFGNVLGSNGSVIPLFRKQLSGGGPLTVTDKEVTRFFMTIPEACELVLEAGAMGEGGEIYVFDMGEPIKIYDLAKKMIRLSGFTEDQMQIKIVGLRPGEKLYEEVLSDKENVKKTHHPKIHIAQVRALHHQFVKEGYLLLENALRSGNDKLLVKQMKSLVPEFKSNNSIFQSLDIQSKLPVSSVS
jgi:FlaA1/EpsC-like NDP-sugar epimerase